MEKPVGGSKLIFSCCGFRCSLGGTCRQSVKRLHFLGPRLPRVLGRLVTDEQDKAFVFQFCLGGGFQMPRRSQLWPAWMRPASSSRFSETPTAPHERKAKSVSTPPRPRQVPGEEGLAEREGRGPHHVPASFSPTEGLFSKPFTIAQELWAPSRG